MSLNQEQAAAVEYLSGPLLVLAGPGTGKTQLLSTKVAYILEHTDANPENILCLTFTESGASNMRERLASIVGKAAANVNIHTYHAFGSNLLERYKNYAENFDRSLDSVIDNVTEYKILHDIQNHLPALDILKTANINDLSDTIKHAKSARLSASDLKQIAERNLADSTELSSAVSDILQNLVPRMKFNLALDTVYQPLLEVLTEYSSSQPIVGNIEPCANHLARELHDIIEVESAKDKPSVSALNRWKDRRFERTDTGDYRLKDHIANRKLLSLANIMAKYNAQLEEEGLFDFADMIEEAIKALKQDRGFRLSLSEVFQYILLDEFQDTNPSQFELIKLLTDYDQPNVMAVGDDDQAIFAFQGANASNLLDFQNHYQAKIITLRDNYRSTGKILDFSHQVAEQINDSFAKHHHINKVLRSMQDTFHPELEQTPRPIERHEFTAASDEYYWLTQRIKHLIASGEDPSDIAVIAAKHKYLATLLPYFKAENIDLAYEKRSNLLEDTKICELATLAEFIYDLATEHQTAHRLLEILAFPFLEIDPLLAIQSVHAANNQKQPPLDYLLNSDSQQLQTLAKWLATLTALSFETPLELWLDYLIGTATTPEANFCSPYLTYYTEHGSSAANLEFYEQLNTLRDTVIAHVKNPRPKLADFIAMLRDYREAGATIVNTSPYQDSDHAVQLMSAHKSKGLEFKYVFIIATDELAWGKAKGNNNLFSLPINLVSIRHTGITDDEQLRLLFVAITRAKQHLIMTNSITDFNNKKVARLQYLNEQRDDQPESNVSPLLPQDEQIIKTHYTDFDLDTRINSNHHSWSAAYQILTPNIKKLLLSRLEHYRLTATDLTTFIDLIYAGPETIYRHRILHAPEEPLTSTLAYGNLIHSTLEQVTNAQIDDDRALEFYHEKSCELPLSSREIIELQDKGSNSLKIVLREFRNILRSDSAKAEVNLSAEHLNLDGIPITGKIDHLHLDPKTKTIEIYDFKTGTYHNSKWESHPTLYKYALQLGFYKLLLNASPTYRNYQVIRGHILFVSPDADGQVYDKVYEYSAAAENELIQLARVVYRQITSLEFVENPELNLPADKSHTLKDTKTFIAKLLTLES